MSTLLRILSRIGIYHIQIPVQALHERLVFVQHILQVRWHKNLPHTIYNTFYLFMSTNC